MITRAHLLGTNPAWLKRLAKWLRLDTNRPHVDLADSVYWACGSVTYEAPKR